MTGSGNCEIFNATVIMEATAFDIVQELGLAFPRTEEGRYFGGRALKVDGEVFVVQARHRSAEPNSISVMVGFKRRDELIANNPRAFYLKPHYENYAVVLVRLDHIDRGLLSEVLRFAHDAVASGEVKTGRSRVARRSSLPKKNVRPRTRSA
jgi:hypothetical protein